MKAIWQILLILFFLPTGALAAGDLREAVLDGNITEVSRLIGEGSDVNEPDENHTTPLHHAAFNNLTKLAELLIANGATLEAVDGGFGYTPLHVATHTGEEEVALLLIEKGADVNSESKNGSTPLHLAAGGGFYAIASALVRHGADLRAVDEEGTIPLHAAAAGHGELVELLIQNGSDVNAGDGNGLMPLHWAASNGWMKTAEVLISSGAFVNGGTNQRSISTLHFACFSGHTSVVELLIKLGADLHTIDGNGHTPFFYAVRESCRELEVMLRRHGGDRLVGEARDTSTPEKAFRGHWLAELPGSEREKSEFFFRNSGMVTEVRNSGMVIRYDWRLAHYDEDSGIMTLRMDDDPDDGVHVIMTGSFGDGYNHFLGYLSFRATSFEGQVTLLADDEHTVDENWDTNQVLISMTYIDNSEEPPIFLSGK